jgi:hypothetical protein
MSQYIRENETLWAKSLGIGTDGAKAVTEKGSSVQSRYVKLLIIQDGPVASYIGTHQPKKNTYRS